MKPRKSLIIWVTVVVAVTLVGLRLFRNKAHHHPQEKVSGDASFDVYADGSRIHLLTLRQHGEHQVLRYRRIENEQESEAVELPHAPQEKIISRRSNDVRIAAHGEHLLALWQISGTGYGNRGPLRFAESHDSGRLWKSIAGPLASGRSDDQGFAALTATRDGTFHAVWLDLQAKDKGLRYAALTGGKWSPVTTIDAATCQCCWNTLRENPQGELMVLYRNLKPRDMALARLSARGWQKSTVDKFTWQIDACPHAGGGLATDTEFTYAVTWTGLESAQGCYFQRQSRSEPQWRQKTRLGGMSARNPDVAVTADKIAVVWDEFEGEHRFIKAQTSGDKGTTWSKPLTLTSTDVSGSYPRVVANSDGFTVVWSETKAGQTAVRHKNL